MTRPKIAMACLIIISAYLSRELVLAGESEEVVEDARGNGGVAAEQLESVAVDPLRYISGTIHFRHASPAANVVVMEMEDDIPGDVWDMTDSEGRFRLVFDEPLHADMKVQCSLKFTRTAASFKWCEYSLGSSGIFELSKTREEFENEWRVVVAAELRKEWIAGEFDSMRAAELYVAEVEAKNQADLPGIDAEELTSICKVAGEELSPASYFYFTKACEVELGIGSAQEWEDRLGQQNPVLERVTRYSTLESPGSIRQAQNAWDQRLLAISSDVETEFPIDLDAITSYEVFEERVNVYGSVLPDPVAYQTNALLPDPFPGAASGYVSPY